MYPLGRCSHIIYIYIYYSHHQTLFPLIEAANSGAVAISVEPGWKRIAQARLEGWLAGTAHVEGWGHMGPCVGRKSGKWCKNCRIERGQGLIKIEKWVEMYSVTKWQGKGTCRHTDLTGRPRIGGRPQVVKAAFLMKNEVLSLAKTRHLWRLLDAGACGKIKIIPLKDTCVQIAITFKPCNRFTDSLVQKKAVDAFLCARWSPGILVGAFKIKL